MNLMTGPPLIEARIREVRVDNRSEPVLRDIDLRIGPGEFILLCGSAESGKSVLCRCLAGVIPLFEGALLEGDVFYQGCSLKDMRLPELAGKIGLVRSEAADQLFCTTVENDLAFGPGSLLLSRKETGERVRWALDFAGLEGFGERKPESLSGGESQRAALASVLTLMPRVLILDRSASQVDWEGRKKIYKMLRGWSRAENRSVLLVDEQLADSRGLADRMLILDNGSLMYDGEPTSYLPGEGGPSPVKAVDSRQSRAPHCGARRAVDDETCLPEHPNGARVRFADAEYRSEPPREGTPVLSVQKVHHRYRDSEFALQNVSLDVYPGEFVAIGGKNGAGKTTLAKLINGLLRPHRGEVIVHSFNTRMCSAAKLARYVGTCFQNPHLQICTGSVREEVGFAMKLRKTPKGEMEAKVDAILERMHLMDAAKTHPYRLSPGRLQQVALASVLVNEPRILILDEPTSQMSMTQKWRTMEVVKEFNERGMTVLIISHDPEAVFTFCRRVVVMRAGFIVQDSGPEGWSARSAEFHVSGPDSRQSQRIRGQSI